MLLSPVATQMYRYKSTEKNHQPPNVQVQMYRPKHLAPKVQTQMYRAKHLPPNVQVNITDLNIYLQMYR